MKNLSFLIASLVLTVSAPAAKADLSPESWDADTRARLFELNATFREEKQMATGENGAIAGTTGAPAVYAGLMALEQGGTAADAVVTTALMQIALAKGSWVSYAGIFTMVYYDACQCQHTVSCGRRGRPR